MVGADAIRSAARRRPVFAIVAARDAADNALGRLGELKNEAPLVRIGSKEELGRAVGRGVAALVGLTDRELATRIVGLGGAGDAGAGHLENDARDHPRRLDT